MCVVLILTEEYLGFVLRVHPSAGESLEVPKAKIKI